MIYLGIGIYLLIGIFFTIGMWLNFAAHSKKYFRLTIFAVILTLTWGYLFIAFGVGALGVFIAHLTTKNEPFWSKIPIALYVLLLEKMYQSLHGVWGGQFINNHETP